jgi:Protein of unknown function (DUF2807).
MNIRSLALGGTVLLATVALAGCAPLVARGPMTTESPEIGDVTSVVLDTSGDLVISEGEPSLTIHAPANVMDRLTTRVHDGELVLGRDPGPWMFGSSDIRYELTVRSLDELVVDGSGDVTSSVSSDELRVEVSGSGTVTLTGIDAESVTVEISGSGDVELAGAARSLAIALDGSGEVDADDLEVVDAVVEISGSGDVDLYATGTLRAEVSGSGTVEHRGGARVDADVSGSGDVTPRD